MNKNKLSKEKLRSLSVGKSFLLPGLTIELILTDNPFACFIKSGCLLIMKRDSFNFSKNLESNFFKR